MVLSVTKGEAVILKANYFSPVKIGGKYDWINSKSVRLDFRVTETFQKFFKDYCVKNKRSPSDILMNSFTLYIVMKDMPDFLTNDQKVQLEQGMDHFLKG